MGTINDIKHFILLLFMILFAYANFFFIINNNTPKNEAYKRRNPTGKDFHCVDDYTTSPFLNSLIAMWLLGMGEFDLDGTYPEGENSYIVWTFFLTATFLVILVFMNMLIAIMSESFANVNAEKEESSLNE